MKKKVIIFIVVLILLSIGAGFYYFTWMPRLELINKEVEADKEATLNDIVTLKNAKDKYTFSAKKSDINLGKCGEYTAIYTIKKNGEDYKEKEIKFSVIDTTKPVISGESVIKVVKDSSDFDISKYVTVSDNSTDDIKIGIEGKYNIKKDNNSI